ncbi:MAG TPA: hypothetical protein EYH01_06405 [Campylobacterales bacterium]|nr:hypothetical protein [Campylobacterales bacterium]
MSTIKIFIIILVFLNSYTYAADKAQTLVDSKQKSDMTYKELMQIMGRSSLMVHQGILTQNRQMVKDGAYEIAHHKAPNHKPWLIMKTFQYQAFKDTLVEFDKQLHHIADAIIKVVDEEDWTKTQKAFHELTLTCISCHISWKSEAHPINPKQINSSNQTQHPHKHPTGDEMYRPPLKMLRDLPRRDIP